MYYPFLRGKQFELIALREIAAIISDGHVSPIIEPVKKKTSTYTKTIELLISNNINFSIVINPVVGDIKGNIDYVVEKLLPEESYRNFQLGVIIHNHTEIEYIADRIIEHRLRELPIVIVLASIKEESIELLNDFIDKFNIQKIITGSQIMARRGIMRTLRKTRIDLVSLTDPYNKQLRNKDYAFEDDEFFSEEHLYFTDEGFSGYSDFLTIGQEYMDKGYSPYAVAIHLTYLSQENIFRIHHFVSDSNEDTSDVGGKFGEALQKLIPFIDRKELFTIACNEFRKLNEEQRYPGLGTVKKLSILNHLEIVNNFFSE